MISVDGQTKMLGLIGYPVEHSFSPQMHNYMSEKYGLNYVYTALSVKPEELGQAIEGIYALNYAGINVTAPHKVEVIKYLDEISDDARMYGSVNTVKRVGERLVGYNTDADGYYLSLLEAGGEVIGKDILILGAGGACRPICIKFAKLGAKSITLLNRTVSKAEALAGKVKDICGYDILTKREHSRYDLVINTTSVGMHPDINKCPTDDFSYIDSNTAVSDMIYNPDKTLFLKNAEEQGAKAVINGLGMLIYQGIIAYEIFCDIKTDSDIYYDIKREVFKR